MSTTPRQTAKQARQIRFARVVMALQSSHPELWAQFMADLAARLDEITESCIASPPDNLLIQNQGRALEARELFKELAGARDLAVKAQEQEQKNVQSRSQR